MPYVNRYTYKQAVEYFRFENQGSPRLPYGLPSEDHLWVGGNVWTLPHFIFTLVARLAPNILHPEGSPPPEVAGAFIVASGAGHSRGYRAVILAFGPEGAPHDIHYVGQATPWPVRGVRIAQKLNTCELIDRQGNFRDELVNPTGGKVYLLPLNPATKRIDPWHPEPIVALFFEQGFVTYVAYPKD